ncbi:hypothetical protein BH10ACT1_BH10ACT1_27070 [soil metagenome]
MAAPHAEVETGTDDPLYDLILVLQQALEDATRYECFARDSRDADPELADFFEELAGSDREIADRAKALLLVRLSSAEVPGGVRP